MEFSNIITLLEDAKAIAPPEPPSPIMIEIFGTFSDILLLECAIADAFPFVRLQFLQAPASTKVMMVF